MLGSSVVIKNWLRFPTLVLSALLHLAPLMRVAVAESTVAASPLLAVLRWFTGAAAVAGAFHGVSGATGLSVTQGGVKVTTPTGTNGIAINGFRMAITSTSYGTARAYTFRNMPAGLIGSTLGVITGTPSTTGSFTVTVIGWDKANASGDNFSTTFKISVLDQVPLIITPPANATVAVGAPVTFTATVTGTGLTYRWLKDDIELAAPAGTAASYIIASAKLTDAGRYKLRVSNTGGVVVSAEAVLTVTQAGPTIVTPPHAQEVHAGESVTFSVVATGGATLAYQWVKGAQFIPNATSSTLTLSSVALSDADNYTVAVTSGGTTVTSASAVLKVGAGLGAVLGGVAADGTATVSVNTIAGRSYVMEEALDLAGTWTTATPVTATGATTSMSSAPASGSGMENRFWRVRVVPLPR